MMIRKRSVILFCYLVIYKILLDIAYILFVNKHFEYMGFILDFNGSKYIFSIIILILIYIVIPKSQEKPSSIFMQLHCILMIMPMLTIYSFMNQSSLFFIMSTALFIMQSIALRFLPNIKIVRVRYSKYVLYTVLFVLTAIVYISMIKANGIPSLRALNFMEVYDIRSGVSYSFLMPYFVNWQAKIINPFLITVFFIYNKKILLTLAISLQLLLYLITAHKSFLFIPIAILLVVKFLSKYDFFKTSLKTASLGISGILLVYVITKSIFMPSYLIRRLLFVPAQIKFYYYDFFSENPFVYFSQSVIGEILNIESLYEKTIPLLIGEVYFNDPNTWANTGYIADAYANMGFFGMTIITILFIIVLKLIDSLSTKLGTELTVGLALFPMLSLNDSAFFTTLLTGGLLFLLCVLYLYSSTKAALNEN